MQTLRSSPERPPAAIKVRDLPPAADRTFPNLWWLSPGVPDHRAGLAIPREGEVAQLAAAMHPLITLPDGVEAAACDVQCGYVTPPIRMLGEQ